MVEVRLLGRLQVLGSPMGFLLVEIWSSPTFLIIPSKVRFLGWPCHILKPGGDPSRKTAAYYSSTSRRAGTCTEGRRDEMTAWMGGEGFRHHLVFPSLARCPHRALPPLAFHGEVCHPGRESCK
jgi:hypothetical protein